MLSHSELLELNSGIRRLFITAGNKSQKRIAGKNALTWKRLRILCLRWDQWLAMR